MKASGYVESAVVSNDGRWLVTGDDGRKGIVWNAQTHAKVLEVTEHSHLVYTVDISRDSTRFASGSCDKTARIFSITTGVRLIPPLQHDRAVVGLRFSPDGDRLVTATYDVCVRIYNSRTGDKLFDIPVRVMHAPTTPFAWSSDGQELFVVSPGKITCLSMFGSSSSEWQIHNNCTRASIGATGRFIACSAGSSVSLWDAISHEQIGVVIERTADVLCITLSPHVRFLACGHGNRISIYMLSELLPDLYLPSPTSRPSRPPPPSPPSRLSITSWPPPMEKCVTLPGTTGDGAFISEKHDGVVAQYSAALSPNPTNSVNLLVERSRARAAMRLWGDALEDANEVIRMDPSCHYAYACKHAALHGTGRYDEAIEAFDNMLSLIEHSGDPEIRQLCSKYVSTSQKRRAIEDTVRKVFKHGPLVLIDVTTGRLCDRQVLPDLFKSDLTFKELVSSMTEEIDKERIRKTINEYFGHVMFSHVWGSGKEEEKKNEPSFKAVKNSESVHRLPDAPMNNKLRNFCAKVAELGYRWAWSDTCCIDKSDDAILNRSLRSMYKWYEASDATLVFLGDVTSDIGDIIHSLWMTRAWTLQEALAPKRILFYDRDWKLYRGVISDNHKKPGVILQELSDAVGVPPEALVSFHPDSLGVREKLRLASTRTATIEEDTAYSLMGIFKSDIIPRYGEGEDALGHLLEGVVAHLGEVTVLAWIGSPSSYNSCLPSTLAVYSKTPYAPPTLDTNGVQLRMAQLSTALTKDETMNIYYRVVHLPPARFANRRLQLPCIVFHVKSLDVKDWDSHGNRYRAKVSGLGKVEFTTADRLPLAEPRRLVFIHPWISDIRGPHGGIGEDASDSDVGMDSEPEVGRDVGTDEESGVVPPLDAPPLPVDDHTLALQMIVRLQQPFNALLLLRQPGGEHKRVAAEGEIIVQVSENRIRSKDIRTEVLDIL
ncbi:hypothetical protein HD554DRAFT_1529887 [Boletus coccyginus]|nr:hypothetical protein HD554DRAFT_1529887 [Boletus coccyginus]